MFDWFEGLKAAQIILGWLGGTISALFGLFWFLDKRHTTQVDAKVKAAGVDSLAVSARLKAVEDKLSEDDKRLRNIEVLVASLPTAKELADLRVEVSAVGATTRAMAEQVDTLYNAALRADRGKSS